MAAETSVRTWKTAAMALGGTSALLAVLLVLQTTGRLNIAAMLGSSGGYAGSGAVPVKLGEFKGDPVLAANLKELVAKRLAEAGPLGYSSPGVTGVVVGGSVTTTVIPSATNTGVRVKTALYVTKEPGSGLLGVLTSSAEVEGGASEVKALQAEGLDAAGNAAFDDLPGMLK